MHIGTGEELMIYLYVYISIYLSMQNAQWMLVPFLFSSWPPPKSWLEFKDLPKFPPYS